MKEKSNSKIHRKWNRRQGKYVQLKNNPVDKKGMPNDITYIEDCLTGEKRPFMNDKQWKEVYQKNGVYENNMEYMDGSDFNWKTFYIDKNILYVVDTYGILAFSIDLEGDQTPRYERQLSEWLEKTESGCKLEYFHSIK